jgi:hypothetical protein
MQISWVLSEQERDRRFNKLKKISYRNNLTTGTTALVKTEPVTAPDPISLFKTPEIQFTVEEQLRIESWKNYIGDKRNAKYAYFFTCEQVMLVFPIIL